MLTTRHRYYREDRFSDRPITNTSVCCCRAAEGEPQRVATAVFHLVPAACRLLCAQHVRRSCRRELSQVS